MSRTTPALFLHEEVLLLAMHDEEGTVAFGSHYLLAMGGGIAADLWLDRRIGIQASGSGLVDLENPAAFGSDVLNDAISRIASAGRRASLKRWVSRFSQLPRLKHRTAEGLCQKGVLREDVGRILLIFRRKIYPERDPCFEKDILTRLRKVIFSGSGRPDPRTTALLSLVHHADLLRIHFDRRSLRDHRGRIEGIIAGDPVGQAIHQCVQDAKTAATVAAITPCIAS